MTGALHFSYCWLPRFPRRRRLPFAWTRAGHWPVVARLSIFGYDEPNYTYMPHGRKLVGELAALPAAPAYFRTHSLLVTGDGQPALKWGSTNAYTEDATGRPVYDFAILDRIFDTYLQARASRCRDGLHAASAIGETRALPARLAQNRDPGGLGVSAKGLPEVGRADPSVSEALRGALREGGGRELVVEL